MGTIEKDMVNEDYKFLDNIEIKRADYAHIYEKGLELIKAEPHPQELLLKILEEYSERFEELPNFNSDTISRYQNTADFDTKTEANEQLKSLVMFGTQAALIKENARIQENLRVANQNYKDLLSVVTHEFKNSLTSIYGYNRIINKRIADGRMDSVEELTTNVDKLSKKLFSLVDKLMNMSQIDQNKMRLENKQLNLIEDVIEPVISELELQVSKKSMAIELFSQEDDFNIVGDASLLQVVIKNLVINAVQYGFENTDVEIKVARNKEKIFIEVFNKGVGLPQKYLGLIFEKFSRFHTKYNQTNVGIGLFTVKHIVELHKGTITAESEEKEWTRFLINLPIK